MKTLPRRRQRAGGETEQWYQLCLPSVPSLWVAPMIPAATTMAGLKQEPVHLQWSQLKGGQGTQALESSDTDKNCSTKSSLKLQSKKEINQERWVRIAHKSHGRFLGWQSLVSNRVIWGLWKMLMPRPDSRPLSWNLCGWCLASVFFIRFFRGNTHFRTKNLHSRLQELWGWGDLEHPQILYWPPPRSKIIVPWNRINLGIFNSSAH